MAEQYEGPGGHPVLSEHSVIDDDDFLDRFALIGEPRHVAERLQQLIELGITRFVLMTRSINTDVNDEMADRVAQEVLPLLDRPPTNDRRSV